MNARPEDLQPKPSLIRKIRQWMVDWLLDDVHIKNAHFGENSITLSPAGIGDVVRWSGSVNAQASGDLGMNTTTGRPNFYDGSSTQTVAHEAEVIKEDGTNTFTADQSMGGNKLTNLGTPTTTGDATTKAYVDSLVSGLQWIEPADVDDYLGNVLTAGLVGNLGEVALEALPASAGDAYVVSAVDGDGTLNPGGVTSLAVGDVVEFDGVNWVRLLAGSGGFVPTSAMALSTATALVSPYTDSTDDGKIAVFDGTSLTGVLTTQATGNCLVVSGSAAAGVDDGDTIEWSGSAWATIVTNVANFVPDGTRLICTTGTVLASGPLTSSTDEGKILQFDGTTNDATGLSSPDGFYSPSDGDAILVNGETAQNENKAFTFDGAVPTGSWVQFAGSGGDHGSLSGLGDDDHAQYALLAGRAGGQTLIGGTASGEDLSLESTSNVTKGDVILVDGTDLRMDGNNEFTPNTDTEGSVGTASLRFGLVRGVTVTSGDHNFVHTDRGVAWTMTEFHDGLYMVNRLTGEWFKMDMTRCAPRCDESELCAIEDELELFAPAAK